MTQSLREAVAAAAVLLFAAASPGWAQSAPQFNILPFFVSVEIDLRDDGSGTMSVSYPAVPVTTFGTEQARFASPTTRVTDVKIQEGKVFSTIAFEDVTRLSEIPELSNIRAERKVDANGEHRVTALLRSPFLGDVKTDQNLTVRITVPGTLVKSNAQESTARTALWRAPATQFFKAEGIDIQVSYRPENRKSG